MRIKHGFPLAVLLFAPAALIPTFAHAAPGDIYNLGGWLWSYGYAINASGQVVGYSYLTAFLYTGTPGSGGAMADLGVLDGTSSTAYAINDAAQVVGASDARGKDHAFLYTGTPGHGGAMTDLGTLGGSFSYGRAINDSGQVAGYSETGVRDNNHNINHAFLYTGIPGSTGTMADLGTLGGTDSYAFGINASGQVAGYSVTADIARAHAFLYSGAPGNGGAMADLGTLGGFGSYGQAINSSGQVVGFSNSTDNGEYHAFRYTGIPGHGGTMADLGTLGGTQSYGYGINAGGQVVGEGFTAGNDATHAFLYTGTPGIDGRMIDLDAWLDAINPVEGAKWTLEHAYGLNDTGLITGDGFYNDGVTSGNRAFILDASALVPEPTSLFLLSLGGTSLLLRRLVQRP